MIAKKGSEDREMSIFQPCLPDPNLGRKHKFQECTKHWKYPVDFTESRYRKSVAKYVMLVTMQKCLGQTNVPLIFSFPYGCLVHGATIEDVIANTPSRWYYGFVDETFIATALNR